MATRSRRKGLFRAGRSGGGPTVPSDVRPRSKPFDTLKEVGRGTGIADTLVEGGFPGLRRTKGLGSAPPEDAERFVAETDGPVIYKAFLASAMAWRETRVLRPEDRAMLASVRYALVIFQAFVPARLDLRVTAIGERILAAAAETATGEYPADVRMNPGIKWRPYELPAETAEGLLALMRRLGLEYGAVDFRVTPEGEHVFLEVNPAGQFLFIENATGMKIADTLAGHLAGGRR